MKSTLPGAILSCLLVSALPATEPGAARVIVKVGVADPASDIPQVPAVIRFRAPAAFVELQKRKGTEPVIETQLVLRNPAPGGQEYRFVWSADNPLFLQPPTLYSLVNGEEYDFEITTMERSNMMRFTTIEVTKIVGRGGVIYDRSVCEVHGTKMNLVKVPIQWGIPNGRLYAPDAKTTNERYPNCWDYLDGGCVVGKDRYKYGYRHQCGTCLEEATQWIKENLPEWRHVTPMTTNIR